MLFILGLCVSGATVLLYWVVYRLIGQNSRQTEIIPPDQLIDAEIDQREIRKKVDLHYNRTLFASNANYVEFYFHCCFYELFNIESGWESDLNGNEILDLLKILEIDFDKQLVSDVYKNQQDHSVEVFHSTEDEQVFVYFDLEKDPTDGNDMFFLGISCKRADEPKVHELLLKIFKKLKTTSPFSFDIWNHQLYDKVFRSYFYFYNNDYNAYKRQMHHHNLKQNEHRSE